MFPFYNDYIVPFLSASLAALPLYHPLEKKTHLQMNTPLTHFCLKKAFREGCKAAPKMGGAIGMQLICQQAIEKKSTKEPSPIDIATSSIIVGGASTPFWVILNGQTLGWNTRQSLKALNIKQTSAIISREAIFLFSLRISTPLNEQLKNRLGESKTLSYASHFFTAALGSFLSHPADTFLTLSQANKKIEIQRLMKGSAITSIALGIFSVLYHDFKERLTVT